MLVIAVWLTAGTLAQNAYYQLIVDQPFRFGFLFDVRAGRTPVDWYSAIALFGCAVAMAIVARVTGQRRLAHPRRWTLLSAVFVFLSLDEGADLHERVNSVIVLELVRTDDGLFSYGWVIPAGVLVVFLGLFYLPLVRDLPEQVRRVVIAAAASYLAGALALEGLTTLAYRELRLSDFALIASEATQDLLEMVGIALLAYALAVHLERIRAPVVLEFSD
jgi:hypothetical protein